MLCVFNGGEEGRILGGIDAAVVRSWTAVSLILRMGNKFLLTSPWLSIDKCHWKWFMRWRQNVGLHPEILVTVRGISCSSRLERRVCLGQMCFLVGNRLLTY